MSILNPGMPLENLRIFFFFFFFFFFSKKGLNRCVFLTGMVEKKNGESIFWNYGPVFSVFEPSMCAADLSGRLRSRAANSYHPCWLERRERGAVARWPQMLSGHRKKGTGLARSVSSALLPFLGGGFPY